ncbi:hypothetical protein [Streptomyces sp. NPDC090025]|uniref:hypothetical protein n=1 Tax=Streptomyces sp. NPDC090025 TaxID=3365922 RepID=UPI003837B680
MGVIAGCGALLGTTLVAFAPTASADEVCGAPVVTDTATTITCTAEGTGSVTVPDGATSGHVVLLGAGGGPSSDGVPGGKGARVEATLAVTPGATLNVAIGAQGFTFDSYPGSGGTGGGLVAVTAADNSPLLTAGSGGGAGGPGIATPAFPGTPGGDSGSPGSAGAGDSVGGGGGRGGAGTATAGGAGGTAAGAGQTPGSNAGAPGGWPNAQGGAPSGSIYYNAGFGGYGGAGYGSGGAGGGGGVDVNSSGDQTGGAGGSGGGGSSRVSGTVPGSPSSVTDGVNSGDGSIVFTFRNGKADIAVGITPTTHLGILVPYLSYNLTARNIGPDAVTSATLTVTLPPGARATNLAAGCTTSATTVTCSYGAIASGSTAAKSFRVPLGLLSLGPLSVTGTRTASAPLDPDPANDSATATCTVVSIILVTCP